MSLVIWRSLLSYDVHFFFHAAPSSICINMSPKHVDALSSSIISLPNRVHATKPFLNVSTEWRIKTAGTCMWFCVIYFNNKHIIAESFLSLAIIWSCLWVLNRKHMGTKVITTMLSTWTMKLALHLIMKTQQVKVKARYVPICVNRILQNR